MPEFKFPEYVDAPMFYSVDDVARLTQLAPRTVRRAISDGDLVACRLRHQLRIPVSALHDWASSSVVAPRAQTFSRPDPSRQKIVNRTGATGRLRPLLEAS